MFSVPFAVPRGLGGVAHYQLKLACRGLEAGSIMHVKDNHWLMSYRELEPTTEAIE
jgi:hypothetical protein